MSEYPGQELSLEQLFYAVNAKILEQHQICQSCVPVSDQQRWVSTWVIDLGITLEGTDKGGPVPVF